MTGRASRLRRAALALCAGGVAACGDPTGPFTVADVTGTYVLVSIGGRALPYSFADTTTTFVADTVRYAADGTWSSAAVSGGVRGAPPLTRFTYAGTWTLDARRRAVLETGGPPGRQVTVTYVVRDGGRTLVYTPPQNDGDWVRTRVP